MGLGINRNDRNSWDTLKWPDPFGKGIICSDGVGQSELMWYARSLPKVHTIYSKIWDTTELMTSFDGYCFWRPFEYKQEWRTQNAKWYHLDQNGSNKPHRICIQGFLNVFPSGPNDGGLVIVPKTHTTIFTQIFANTTQWKGKSDWIPLHNNRALWENMLPKAGLSPIKVCAEAGDFVVWDSRIIHCNAAAEDSREIPTDGTLLPPRRLVTYICMTPKSRLNPTIMDERRRCYYSGDTTSHWPEDVTIAAVRRNKNKNYVPIPLSDYCANLIPL
uniref:Phytanoyl-CoA dioxygenase n=1 Tax=Arcella intermedia TaxID=1963864 RepID=A0A6B2LAA0_9EUKA